MILLVLFSTLFGVRSHAQNQPPQEIGLRLTGLENFDLIYKREKNTNQFFRHRLGLINFGVTGKDDTSVSEFGLGYAFGIEKRKSVNEKLNFIHGIEPRIATQYSSMDGNTIGWDLMVGVGYVLGFQYDFSDRFYVGLETVPALTYARELDGPSKGTYELNVGFNSSAVALILAHRF